MNSIIISGNLGREPEVVTTKSGTIMVRFNVAVSRRAPDGQNWLTSWFNCVAFRETAQTMMDMELQKGTKIIVQGRMIQEKYTDKNGEEKTMWRLYADDFGVRIVKRTPEPPTGIFAGASPADDEEIPF